MIRYLTLFICVIFIYGCSSDDDPQTDPFALSLNSVGDIFAVTNVDTVSFTLTADNPNRVGLVYAASAISGGSSSVVPIQNILFDTTEGTFSWSMAGVTVGSYLIKFTVSDVMDENETDSETVKIVVQDRADQYSMAATLYSNNCQDACHGVDGLPASGDVPDIRCVIQTLYDAKLGVEGTMEGYASSWSNNTDKADVHFYLQHVDPESCP